MAFLIPLFWKVLESELPPSDSRHPFSEMYFRLAQLLNAPHYISFSFGGALNASIPLPLKQSLPMHLRLLPS